MLKKFDFCTNIWLVFKDKCKLEILEIIWEFINRNDFIELNKILDELNQSFDERNKSLDELNKR